MHFIGENHEVQYGMCKSRQFLTWVEWGCTNWELVSVQVVLPKDKWKTKKDPNGGDRRLYECIVYKWSDNMGKILVKEVIY